MLRLWEYPEILDDVGIPTGCIFLELDGSIRKVEVMKKSGNDQVDFSVETALKAMQAKNNEAPTPLPTTPDDLTYLARMPLCWRLKV